MAERPPHPLAIQYAMHPADVPPDTTVAFHTHGVRQYRGTCKEHHDPRCPALAYRRQPHRMSVTLMVEQDDLATQYPRWQCRRCWDKPAWTVLDVARALVDGTLADPYAGSLQQQLSESLRVIARADAARSSL